MKYLLTVLLLCGISFAARATIYVEPQEGFETYLAAAIEKKGVPADVVVEKAKATLTLKATPIDVRKESGAGKIARCLFAYCAGIEDRGSVSVQLIDVESSKVLWAYAVNKARGHKNDQSLAEAVAKHLKDYLSSNKAAK